MSEREMLELIPEPHYSRLLAWLAAGHTGTITLDVVAGRVVGVECVDKLVNVH